MRASELQLPASDDDKYCSEYCRDAKDLTKSAAAVNTTAVAKTISPKSKVQCPKSETMFLTLDIGLWTLDSVVF